MSIKPYYVHRATMPSDVSVEAFRDYEHPQLKGKTYLDHAGAQLPAKSMIEAYAKDLSTFLYGNPHSAETSDITDLSKFTPSHLAEHRIDAIRKRVLGFFNADPDNFKLIFVQNATAAIRLVGECFRDYAAADVNAAEANDKAPNSFWYGYHRDAHSSLTGVREFATGEHRCFVDDDDVERWIQSSQYAPSTEQVALFGYPGQSNMTGRRLPLSWPAKLRAARSNVFTLLDAAALATTAPLNLDEVQPSFTAVSFYKIFGYPDLGALIVHKSAEHMLLKRRYFAGGTVEMVVSIGDSAAYKKDKLEASLEEGTLPFHSIIALDHALDVHLRLYTSMKHISLRTSTLTRYAFQRLSVLRHGNGAPVIRFYKEPDHVCRYGDAKTQGATISLSVLGSDGVPVFYTDVEAEANKRQIYIRSGGLCNPGGIAHYLDWTAPQLHKAYEAGHRCSNPIRMPDGKPVGVVRVSLGACSIKADIDRFVEFVADTYVEAAPMAVVEEEPVCASSESASEGSEKGAKSRREWLLAALQEKVGRLGISRKPKWQKRKSWRMSWAAPVANERLGAVWHV